MVYVGNQNLMLSNNIQITDNLKQKAVEIQSKAYTISYIAEENNVLGFVSFKDKIKEMAQDLLDKFDTEDEGTKPDDVKEAVRFLSVSF